MKNLLKLMPHAAMIWTLLACGCHSPRPEPPSVTGTLPRSQLRAIEKNNALALQSYRQEWKYNIKAGPNEPPKLGVALSGGGMRSGTFSIGVLHGLHKIGVLQDLDIISSVSGGGYAASWFYTQSLSNNCNFQALFEGNPNYYLRYLTNHGELVGHTPAGVASVRRLEYVGVDAPLTVLSWPVNLFANGLFGWHANVVPMRRRYEEGISRTFQVIATKENSDGGWISDGKPAHKSFDDMAKSIQGKLPFFVINTTAHIEDAPVIDAAPLKHRVFEFTPLRYGSDYFGYRSTDFPVDYNRAISIAGAAVDTKDYAREATERTIASAFNADLGYYIDNPRITSGRWWRRCLPYPLYTFSGHYQRDADGDRIYLADGGHSENLGAYSLIRRMCGAIIIVDAGWDPYFDFEDYRILRNGLRTEMGIEFEVPEIERALKKVPDARAEFAGEHPVMRGYVSGFPLKGAKHGQRDIEVVYIKLSIDEKKLANHGYTQVVEKYYDEHKNDVTFGKPNAFPQHSTFDQSYTPDQVLAYHDLGYAIVEDNGDLIRSVYHKRKH